MLVAKFFAETTWEAANGFELTDPIRVLISAQASMLLLGLELDEFPLLTSVIVHPSTVVQRGERSTGGSVRSSSPQMLLGQAHYRGPVLLSWSATRRGAKFPLRGENVVYHEFAHQLDMLDGTVDGTPPLATQDQFDRWVEVCTRVYHQVEAGTADHVLSSYAGVNTGEFFAVATEVFFDDPHALIREHRDLYEVMAEFYRQDPAARTP